jgi:hypothetical protein
MHCMKRFILAFAVMNGLGIAALIGQTSTPQTVPLTAEIDVVSVRTLPDGNTLRQERRMKFYRRADGSTRLEEPNRVVIVDNTAHATIVLDPVAKIAKVQAAPLASVSGMTPVKAVPQSLAAGSSLDGSSSAARTDLGSKVIAGYRVHGFQRTTTIPANSALGNTSPITKTMQVWSSSDLRLPVLTVISDPLGGTTTSQYENISTASPPDRSLFVLPIGYKTVAAPQSRVIESHTN